MMNLLQLSVAVLLVATSTTAFSTWGTTIPRNYALHGLSDESVENDVNRAGEYNPGMADTEFAKRFRHLKGTQIKTVGEAFTDFTSILGVPVNALYKNMMTDLVGTTHLNVVNARFVRDGIWSLGLLTALDLLLKNYPEQDVAEKIKTSLFECVGLSGDEVRSEAKVIEDWANGKSKDDISSALRGEGDSPVAAIAKATKSDEFWMYSRFFGIGLIRMMEKMGTEMNADEVYPIMEDWMTTSLGKTHFTACSDSDTYFKIKSKLDMMETMMKEIEIREKKKMAQRLEEKAEAALRAVERDAKLAEEIEKEETEKKAIKESKATE